MNHSLVKIVKGNLVERSLNNLKEEKWGLSAVRPMVYLSNPHEAIEKSLWCYEHSMVPLIAEANEALSLEMAKMYDIDALLTDPVSLQKLLPYLSARSTKLKFITMFGDMHKDTIAPYADAIIVI